MRTTRLAPFLALALACPTALAQAPAPPAATGSAGAEPREAPPTPAVDDEMLAAPEAPPKVVASWDDAVGILRTRSTDLRIALDEVERAIGAQRQALAGLLPTLTASGNVTGNLIRHDLTTYSFDPQAGLQQSTTKVPEAWTYGASISLTQPLLAPRAWHATGTANLARQNATLGVDAQKRLLALGVANAIVGVVTAERVAELNRIGLRAALERQDLVRRRARLGAANALDLVRADQDVEASRGTVVTGDESLRQSREALGLALGHPEAWGVPPGIRLDAVEASARAACRPAGTVDERADIAAARGQVDLAQRNVDDVWLQFAPTVNLVSTATTASTTLANTGHETWTIAGVLSIPLWDGGYRYGSLRDAHAQVDQAAMRLESARRGAQVQVTQAQRAVQVAEQSRAVAARARDLAAETERLARVSFAAGSGTSLDLVDAGRRLREADTQLALQEFTLVQARLGALLSIAQCQI